MLSELRTEKRQLGVTLLEMLITLAIAAILLTVVAPNAQLIVKKNRIAATINQTSGAFQFARFSAIDQQAVSVICPSSDFATCDNTNWDLPKIVFIDSNLNGNRDSTEALLFTTDAVDTSNNLTGPNITIAFDASGSASLATNLLLCTEDNDATLARELRISFQGRIKLSEDSDNDDVHEDSSGDPLSCS
ncbi:GspH/FimT family pseudopilin [Glaciecola sp. 1036]|uniref:GspH/FimT family pseudopilin n=1 Tax=Alteromonadaceae TaxID=72275 RepID=UPI003D090AAC